MVGAANVGGDDLRVARADQSGSFKAVQGGPDGALRQADVADEGVDRGKGIGASRAGVVGQADEDERAGAVRLSPVSVGTGARLSAQEMASTLTAGSSPKRSGEDEPVVCQGRGRGRVRGDRGAEGGQHGGAGDPVAGGERQSVPGVVVEPGQDLGVLAAGQRVAGEVGSLTSQSTRPALLRPSVSGMHAAALGASPRT